MNNKQRLSFAVSVVAFLTAIACGTEWMATGDTAWMAATLGAAAFAVVAWVGVWASGLPPREEAADQH